MSRTCLSGLAILLLATVGASRGTVESARAEPQEIVKVSADDLASGKAIVIGRLGIPLKTMMTVRGIWMYKPPGEFPRKPTRYPPFHVTHVNGKKLEKPVEFYGDLVHVTYPLPWDDSDKESKEPTPSDGDIWELRVYETGKFRLRPPEFATELGEPPDSLYSLPEWESPFLVELHGIMQRPNVVKQPDQRKTTSTKAKNP